MSPSRIALLSLAGLSVTHAELSFRDVTGEVGLREPLVGLMGHGAAWGDVDGDGALDLFVGGFADRPEEDYAPSRGPVPSMLFRQDKNGRFLEDRQSSARHFARTSGALFIDLDNDGDPELYIANNRKARASRKTEPQRVAQTRGSLLLRNDEGKLVDISTESGSCPDDLFTTRNVGVLDFDRDGLLDLFLVEDRFTKTPRSRLLRNEGGLVFADHTAAAGLPGDLFGLGLATGDLNGDGHADLLVPHSNRLFLGGSEGRFREAPLPVLRWEPLDNEDWPCGAQFADLNRDGRLDLVLAIHSVRARNRLFLNEGNDAAGNPKLRDVTEESGLPAVIPTRCPHVEVQDFDNDGWPDLYFSAGWMDGPHGELTPCIFRHRGCEPGGVPRFEAPGSFDSEMVYFPAGPSADFNRDGRRDLFLVNWFAGNHSRLLQNTTKGGSWLQVRLVGSNGNRPGVGSRVSVRRKGELLGFAEVAVGYGYASGQTTVLHFGLGETSPVDLEVVFSTGTRRMLTGVAPDQLLTVHERPPTP